MKNTFKKSGLIWFSFLFAFWMFSFANLTNGVIIETSPTASNQHTTRVYSLYLWDIDNTNASWIRVQAGKKYLDLWNWINVWKKWEVNNINNTLVAVGWWGKNSIGWDNSWIAGWYNNTVNNTNSAIGWWRNNTTNWDKSVVAWGYYNSASAWGVALWWDHTTANGNGVALWGSNNTAGTNSLVLWSKSTWNEWSFVWSDGVANISATSNSARIDAQDWVLIWTYQKIPWVKLVVKWPVKIGGDNSSSWIQWEIRVIGWCVFAYDSASRRHVLWRASWASCWEPATCVFGKTLLQQWDKVKAYKYAFTTDNCDSATASAWVTCTAGWTLSPAGYVYPYCNKVSR